MNCTVGSTKPSSLPAFSHVSTSRTGFRPTSKQVPTRIFLNNDDSLVDGDGVGGADVIGAGAVGAVVGIGARDVVALTVRSVIGLGVDDNVGSSDVGAGVGNGVGCGLEAMGNGPVITSANVCDNPTRTALA